MFLLKVRRRTTKVGIRGQPEGVRPLSLMSVKVKAREVEEPPAATLTPNLTLQPVILPAFCVGCWLIATAGLA